jgi:deoxyribonuclease-4
MMRASTSATSITVLDPFRPNDRLSRLKVIHLNDSKNPRGSHKDRHENLGYGTIGFDVLSAWAHNPKLAGIPKILETPSDGVHEPYSTEIAMLRADRLSKKLARKAYKRLISLISSS